MRELLIEGRVLSRLLLNRSNTMIAAPCDRNSLEADALEATGRERYIKSLGLLIVHLCLLM